MNQPLVTDTTAERRHRDQLAARDREIAVLREALTRISEGDTMRGELNFSWADVIRKHYAIARAALEAKETAAEKTFENCD